MPSFRTNVFRPNSLSGDARLTTLGGVFVGKMEHIPESKVVDVVWEAGAAPLFCVGTHIEECLCQPDGC